MQSTVSLLARLALVITVTAWSALPVRSAELLMFEEEWCTWCDAWNHHVGGIYSKTEEGKRAPLRRIDIHGTYPDDVTLHSRPNFTPTFVLVDEGKEVGRIEGYPGEDFFWGLLAKLLEKLPAEPTSPTGG